MSLSESLALERYKHLVSQQRQLDLAASELLRLFVKAGVGIVGAGGAILTAKDSLDLSGSAIFLLLDILTFSWWFVGLFTIVGIAAGMFSWVDYRQEEVQLVKAAGAEFSREEPSFRNALRWTETWIVGFVALSLLAFHILVLPIAQEVASTSMRANADECGCTQQNGSGTVTR